jgi:oxygen-independent coproporphyrinogen-3 oxidase
MAGAYVSYPFCGQKCTYCNFASGVFPRELERSYVAALRQELGGGQTGYDWLWTPETVYWGGGSPSRMDPEELASLIALIPGAPPLGQRWAEATMEAAPSDITPELTRAWARAGINRASLGVQSFVRRELAQTGRTHTAETVASGVEALKAAGISNINLDLIAGLPHQTEASWKESLDWIERLDAPHVSVYMLEVDEDSRLGAEILTFGQKYGARQAPTPDQCADYYEIAVERLARLGLQRYEISNFARPGSESRHNLKYWRREPYLGFGSDAHSFDGVWRWSNAESAQDYVQRMIQDGSAKEERTAADSSAEPLFLGLRLSEGTDADWSRFERAVREFEREGLLEIAGRRLRLTPRGVLLSNEVFAAFV